MSELKKNEEAQSKHSGSVSELSAVVMLRFIFKMILPDSILDMAYDDFMHATTLPRDSISISARMYRFFGIRIGDIFSQALRPLFDKKLREHYCWNHLIVYQIDGERGQVQTVYEECEICGREFNREFISG